MQINIIYSNNSYGLSKDAKIIRNVLHGHNFNLINFKTNANLHKADINIFLEILDRNNNFFKEYKKLAPINILFPNPEWFLNSWIKHLPGFDLICCKTKHAVKIFSQWTNQCTYTSFTSDNLYIPITQKEKSFFHSGGKSVNKGTYQLLEAWNDIQEKLYLFHKNYKSTNPNISCTNNYVSDIEFIKIKNKILFHIYPAKYEGFGHNIWESMSCGAIIITTDAPPMNEYNADFYIKSSIGKKHCQARFNEVNIGSLRDKVNQAMKLPDIEILKRITKNKENFKTNDMYFKKRLRTLIKKYV